jgi:hypothetical protein
MTDLEFDDRDTLFRVHSRFHVDNVEDISDVSIKNRIMDAKIAADSGNYVININWAVKTPI